MKSSEIKLINAMIADPTFSLLQTYNQYINSFHLNKPVEVNHSRMIQWLLNPNESHGLGTQPLKTLLNACCNEVIENDEKPTFFEELKIDPIRISQMTLESTISFVEHDFGDGRIDILLVLPEDDIVIIIENKYGATETTNQLVRYRKWGDKKFQEVSVLYLYMDAREKWTGNADKQWLKMSYDWLVELLFLADNNSHVSSRAKQIMKDYHDCITDACLSVDPYFAEVQKCYHKFSQKYAKALAVLDDNKIPDIEHDDYLDEIQSEWNDELRIKHWYLTNEDIIDLLIESSVIEALQEFVEENIDGITVYVGYSGTTFSVHHERWHKFQVDKDDKWCLCLGFFETKNANKDYPDDDGQRFDMKLFFSFINLDLDQFGLIESVWNKYSDKKLDKENLGKNKSLWLESDLSSDENSVFNVVNRYIEEINNLL